MSTQQTIQWDDALATGVPQVDDQHKELIRRAADLQQALEGAGGDAKITEMMSFLGDYVLKHFKDEEDLMQKHNYPGYAAQKNAHDTFLESFKDIKALYEKEGITMTLKAKLKVNVNSWLVSHINFLDKKLGLYLQEKGVQH